MDDFVKEIQETAKEAIKDNLKDIIPDEINKMKASGTISNLTNVKSLKNSSTKALGYSTLEKNILPF